MFARPLPWFLLGSLLLGCASSMSGSRSESSNGDPLEDADSATVDPDAAIGDEVRTTHRGTLHLGDQRMIGLAGTQAGVEFRVSGRPDDARCSSVSEGAWTMVSCDHSGAPMVDTHPRPFPHAGVIEVRGGVGDFALRPSADGVYTEFTEPRVLLGGPRHITLRAEGATVPAFEIPADIPAPLVLLSPQIPVGTRFALPRDGALTLSWSASDAQVLAIDIDAWGTLDGRDHSFHARARLDASRGTAEIPADALRPFTTLSRIKDMTFRATPETVSHHTAGEWSLAVLARGLGVYVDAELR